MTDETKRVAREPTAEMCEAVCRLAERDGFEMWMDQARDYLRAGYDAAPAAAPSDSERRLHEALERIIGMCDGPIQGVDCMNVQGVLTCPTCGRETPWPYRCEDHNQKPSKEPMRKLMVAWTPGKGFPPPYPPYVNVTQVGTMVQVTVRGETKANLGMPDTVSFTVNAWTWGTLCKAIKEGENKFECGMGFPPDSMA